MIILPPLEVLLRKLSSPSKICVFAYTTVIHELHIRWGAFLNRIFQFLCCMHCMKYHDIWITIIHESPFINTLIRTKWIRTENNWPTLYVAGCCLVGFKVEGKIWFNRHNMHSIGRLESKATCEENGFRCHYKYFRSYKSIIIHLF